MLSLVFEVTKEGASLEDVLHSCFSRVSETFSAMMINHIVYVLTQNSVANYDLGHMEMLLNDFILM